MAQTYLRYLNSFGTFWDQVRSPAWGKSVLQSSPIMAARSGNGGHVLLNEDFVQLTLASNTFGGWTFTNATSGTIAQDTTNPNGVVKIDAGAVTAGQGVNWQLNNFPFKLANLKPIWYECRFRFTGLTSLKVQALIGLAVTGTTLITGGAVGTDDKIALTGVTTTGVLTSNCTAATTAGTSTGVTLVNSQWYRLGIYATTTAVQFWIDNAKVATIVANIPTSALAPSFVVQANATVQPVLEVDYLTVLGCRN